MENKHQIWHQWARILHQWGLADFAAVFLNVSGPMRIVLAQAAYLGQPLVDPMVQRRQLQTLAELLENDQETNSFIALLREEEKL